MKILTLLFVMSFLVSCRMDAEPRPLVTKDFSERPHYDQAQDTTIGAGDYIEDDNYTLDSGILVLNQKDQNDEEISFDVVELVDSTDTFIVIKNNKNTLLIHNKIGEVHFCSLECEIEISRYQAYAADENTGFIFDIDGAVVKEFDDIDSVTVQVGEDGITYIIDGVATDIEVIMDTKNK